ncbi:MULTISPECIES: DUF2950 domain-containing protein [unclassified Caballeronia]|uniref:DUF2950 domain-containing protein n=1 Tax=unclassified Caballeronia TaxID=2646786 RepID=UPI0028624F0C|nr:MULTISPECIES: DUF2950 domain-containing protein [unclassified Caballeronia]MDR5738734.1 DUF2950 domain-containing protein [Caballeronia sp. LZ016]MDR5811397.1 DUF2950 domain-containing protein [Caballeronia sp. LZ019]
MTRTTTLAASKKTLLCATLAVSLTMAATIARAQALYPTPDAAAQAFTDAVASNDETALKKVLGKDHARYVPAGSVGEDDIYQYLASWAKEHRIVEDKEPLGGRRSAHIETGDSGWTLPIPLVDTGRGWRFDMPAARDEPLTRRIGRNERSVMHVALAYVDAQNDYRKLMNRYAGRFVSTPGKHDGLYWDTAPGEPDSPLGPLAATMRNKTHPGDAYYGYHYRILTAQGPHAKGGAKNFMEGGALAQGFAMIAWPARYGETGVMSFIVNQDGQVFEKNLGPATARVAASIKAFDPDSSWQPVSP